MKTRIEYLNEEKVAIIEEGGKTYRFMDEDGEPTLTGVFADGKRLLPHAPAALYETAKGLLR